MTEQAVESQDPLVFTTAAAKKVAELIAEEGNPELMLRIYVQGGGCSGFQYGFAFDDARDNDFRFTMTEGFDVIVDAFSMSYLEGAKIEFIDTMQGSGFKVSNPNAVTTCGCGSSFSA